MQTRRMKWRISAKILSLSCTKNVGVQLRLDSGIPDKFIIWLTYSQIFTMFMWWQVIITDSNIIYVKHFPYVHYNKNNI